MDIMISLLTFFLGLGLGHWLALGRDRRKEFNEKAIELNSKFYDYAERDNESFLPSIKEMELFASYVPFYNRWRYNRDVIKLRVSLRSDHASRVFNPVTGGYTVDPEYRSQTNELARKIFKYIQRQ